MDPSSEQLNKSVIALSQKHTLQQLVEELKTPGLGQSRQDEILDIILAHIEQNMGILYQ